jgi:Zn-dependent protease with chaperone function
MTVLALAIFAAATTLAMPRLLASGGGWTYRAPRLGVLAWQASTAAAVLAAAMVGAAAVLHLDANHELVGTVWRLCLDALLGAHDRAGQAAALAGLGLLAAVAVRLGTGWWRVIAGASRRRRQHRAILELARTGRGDRDLTVVAHPEPAAYVVPGRRARIVVTTAALDRLSDAELAAVLAHERAHAAGRHHWLLGGSWLLCRAFPRVPLFASAARETTRLVEMCADDAAVRRHPRLALARALVAMAEPGSPPVPVAGALHSTGGDASVRLRRLLDPPRPLPAPVAALVAVASAALPVVPAAIVALS